MQLSFESITETPVHLSDKTTISVSVLRLDQLHPVISGNKWFKLQYYLKEAIEQNKKKIVTFGGAYSNHIIATAAACALTDVSSAGIIRGEEPVSLSPTLLQAKQYGMELYFTSREDYAEKKIPADLSNEDYYLVNEGGYGQKGATGAAGILDYAQKDFTYCCCAAGTGTMMAGLINSVSSHQKVIGISVLKNNRQLAADVRALLNDNKPGEWEIIHDYHFGGYAKYTPGLIEFMNAFYKQTSVPSDFVYTGKLFYAIADLLKNNFFPEGSKLLIIHSGGLQGNNSLGKGTLIY